MSDLENKLNALASYLLTDDPGQKKRARDELRRLMAGGIATPKDPESIIRSLLLEMGAPDHLVGHPYTVYAIQLVVADRKWIDNITFALYPEVAAHFDTTASRVERAIRHLIEVMFARGDVEVLYSYFGNTISAEKAKPTNGEFLARLAAIVKLRMKNAA